MAEKSENEKDVVKQKKEPRGKVIDILNRCYGRSRKEVLKNASKLKAQERLSLI